VTFGPAEFEKRVTIQTSTDTLVEGTEVFTAQLEPVSDHLVITEDTAEISIQETANVIVEFDSSVYEVDEDAGVVSLTLVKRTPTTQSVTVLISTEDGSATAPLDFSALRNEEVIFAPSETMKTVTVPIQRDNVFEGEESFTASLSLVSGSTGVEIGQQDTAAISIMDDLTISFSSPEFTVPEDGGPVEVCLTTSSVVAEDLTVVLLALESLPVDATDGQDFTGGEYEVQISAGATEHCAQILINDDSIALEGDEVFIVRFDARQLPDGVQLGPDSTSTVRIIDDDDVRVFFADGSYQVSENDGSVSVCVEREGDAAETFSVDVATSERDPVQAEAGSDYTQVVRTLTFSPDDDSQCFSVPILSDQLSEVTEEFTAGITAVSEGVTIGRPDVATISIIDSNVVTLQFGSANYSVVENGGSVTVCLAKSIGSDQPVNVIVSTAPKSATAGVDYVARSMTVTVPASSGPGQTCFDIDILDDSVFENDEEFLVSFQIEAGSDAQIGAVASTCVRIIDDDDEVSVFFESGSVSVAEDDGSVTVCVRTDGEAAQAFSIQVATRNLNPVDATGGSDYQAVTRTLTFQPNENRMCFNVSIMNDGLDEGTESFSAEIISVPSSGVVIGDPERSIISITDDDVVVLEFPRTNYSVFENEDSVTVCLTTSIGSDQPINVIVSTSPKTAAAGADYVARSMPVTVPASSGPGQTCFDIDIIDDSSVENDEEFLVRFQIGPGSSAQIGAVDSTCVRIVDDDDEVRVFFESDSVSVAEDSRLATVCVRTAGEAAQAFSLMTVFLRMMKNF
jgi:hypothetical protein